MAILSVRAAVKQVLTADPRMATDEVIKRVKAMGLLAGEKAIRKSVHNQRTEIANRLTAKPIPAAARVTTAPTPAPAPKSATAVTASDLGEVLSNVALVNTVLGVCGGAGNARQVAEAVGSCGGVEAFLQHLALVETIRGGS